MTTPDTAAIRAQMEALAGFTLGPWEWVDADGTEEALIGPDKAVLLQNDSGEMEFANYHPALDHLKNARLIAAAPDMRETILALCDALDELRAEVLAGSDWPKA